MHDYNLIIQFKRPDGSLIITYLSEGDRLLGESDNDFAERIKQKHAQSNPDMLTLPSKVRPFADLPNAVTTNKRKWRENAGNQIFEDGSVELPNEARLRKLNSAKGKLIAGQPLNQEEADVLAQ